MFEAFVSSLVLLVFVLVKKHFMCWKHVSCLPGLLTLISVISSTTWDEHVFEITLPRSCCIGHVDLKFSLHAPCPSPPHIQVTLLKQNASGIGRKEKMFTPPVDDPIDFNINMQFDGSTKGIVPCFFFFLFPFHNVSRF
jgi:hypothetical protein